MALIQLPAQPRRDLARLGARGCFNEKSGVRGWLWLRGPGGGGLRGLPPSSCPRQLRAALPPARALPALGPHGGAWGPLKRQRFPTSRGPWVQPVMRSRGDAVGPGGWGGAQRTTVGGRGGASRFVTATLGQRDSRPGHTIVHSLASVSSSQIAQPPSGSPMRTGFTEAPTVCLHCAHSTPRPWAVTHPFFR